MPIFFIVGGYSNAVSLESARRKQLGYAGWLFARLNRLIAPLLVLLFFWAALAIVMKFSGVGPGVIQYASQAALIPIWFLAIYTMVVILAPLAYKFWQQSGFASFWVFVAVAILVDVAFFVFDFRWMGCKNDNHRIDRAIARIAVLLGCIGDCHEVFRRGARCYSVRFAGSTDTYLVSRDLYDGCHSCTIGIQILAAI